MDLGQSLATDKMPLLISGLSLCGVDLSSGTGSPGPMFAGALLLNPWKISRPANGQWAMSLRVINKSGMPYSRKRFQSQFFLIKVSIGGRLLPLSSESVEEYIWFRATRPAKEIDVVNYADIPQITI